VPSVTRSGLPAWLPAAPPAPLTVVAPGAAALWSSGGDGGGGAAAAAAVAPFDWPAFARRASDAELLRYLEAGDLSLARPLSAIGARCRDAAFFAAATGALSARGVFEREIWKWAVKHCDERALRQLLPTTDLIQSLGVPLVTPLVTTGDVVGDTGHLSHVEYWPWINAYCRPIPQAGGHGWVGGWVAGWVLGGWMDLGGLGALIQVCRVGSRLPTTQKTRQPNQTTIAPLTPPPTHHQHNHLPQTAPRPPPHCQL